MSKTVLRRRLRLITLLLLYASVAAVAVSTALAELGQSWWIADLFAHFRFQYVSAALALGCLAVLLRRHAATAAAIVSIAANGYSIAIVPQAAAAREGGPADARLRVVTANLQWSNRNGPAIAAYLRASGGDVIALQEYTLAMRPLIESLATDYPYVSPADWRRQRGGDVLLLSRYPLEAMDTRFLAGSYFPIVAATVRHPRGAVRVVALHAPYPVDGALARLHASYFAQWVAEAKNAGLPLVVAGDFNLSPWSPRFRAAWRESGLAFAGDYVAWPRTWPAHAVPIHYLPALVIGGIPIDHVLVSRHFEVSAARRGPYIGSDHYPVAVDLRFAGARP